MLSLNLTPLAGAAVSSPSSFTRTGTTGCTVWSRGSSTVWSGRLGSPTGCVCWDGMNVTSRYQLVALRLLQLPGAEYEPSFKPTSLFEHQWVEEVWAHWRWRLCEQACWMLRTNRPIDTGMICDPCLQRSARYARCWMTTTEVSTADVVMTARCCATFVLPRGFQAISAGFHSIDLDVCLAVWTPETWARACNNEDVRVVGSAEVYPHQTAKPAGDRMAVSIDVPPAVHTYLDCTSGVPERTTKILSTQRFRSDCLHHGFEVWRGDLQAQHWLTMPIYRTTIACPSGCSCSSLLLAKSGLRRPWDVPCRNKQQHRSL